MNSMLSTLLISLFLIASLILDSLQSIPTMLDTKSLIYIPIVPVPQYKSKQLLYFLFIAFITKSYNSLVKYLFT